MGGEYDSPLKKLLEAFPHAFLQLVGILTSAATRLLNVEQVHQHQHQLADTVLLVEEDPPYAVHFEFDSTRNPEGVRRLLYYNVQAAKQHGLPVLTVLVLLRPEADSPEYTGEYRIQVPGQPEPQIVFRYLVIRLWEMDPLLLLENEGTIPLAPMANVTQEEIPELLARVEERLARLDRSAMLERLTQLGLLMGLRFDKATVQEMLKRFPMMKESSFYQVVLEEGLHEGLQKGEEIGLRKGRLQAERDAVVRVGRTHLGEPPVEFVQRLASLEDEAVLARMVEKAVLAKSWDEILED